MTPVVLAAVAGFGAGDAVSRWCARRRYRTRIRLIHRAHTLAAAPVTTAPIFALAACAEQSWPHGPVGATAAATGAWLLVGLMRAVARANT